MTDTIRAHNEKAAAVWGSGGSAYDRVSETVAECTRSCRSPFRPSTWREVRRCGDQHWLDGKTSESMRGRRHRC